ncbi:MAG: hypothetical protein JSR95_01175 [Proteobacteria bacterium]|nr:hypothetical protein [Pseudomonadota bacterium]
MTEAPEPAHSIAWLIALVGGSALLMALWFFLHPGVALACSAIGVLLCMAARWSLDMEQPSDPAQADRRDP